MKAALKLIAIATVGLCLVCALIPWKLRGATKYAEIAASISDTWGLSLRIGGQITLKILPRPRVQISNVSIRDSRDALSADAPTLYGDLDLAGLFRGQWRLTSATMTDPTVTIDAGKLATEGPAGASSTKIDGAPLHGFKLAFRSGVIRIRSQHPGSDTLITDVDGTAQLGSDPDGSLALSGSAVWHSALGQFTGRIASPRAILRGGVSAASLQITSSVGSFSAAGDLSGGSQQQFAGRIGVSTNGLPRLFATMGLPAPSVDVQRAILSGDALARIGDISLSNSTLRLDDTEFEGTLGFHSDGNRSLIEGTLATDFLDLGHLLRGILDPKKMAVLYRTPIVPEFFSTNVDLRISASTARWAEIKIQDAALSMLSHNGRVEVTLDEATAFNGIVKARATAGFDAAGIQAHADVSMSGVDLGAVSAALSGQERVSGALSGKVGVEGHGRTLSELVGTLAGTGQVNVENGSFMGLSVTQALKRFARKLPLVEGRPAQITSFDSASAALQVANGKVNIVDGRVTGPGMQLTFDGHSDLPDGKVEIVASAAPTDAAGSLVPNGPRLPFKMHGSWGERLLVEEHTPLLGFPSLPILDGAALR